MNIIEAIERGELVTRDAFRTAELNGELAPHVFVENPTNAVCQDCELIIYFRHLEAEPIQWRET